jgi:DNA (cytosine-5)-methyltransferase 1
MGADDFTIHVGDTRALFGFGDAVCVPCITWIARHCLNPLIGRLDDATASIATASTAATSVAAQSTVSAPCR